MLILACSFAIVATTFLAVREHRAILDFLAALFYELNYNIVGTFGIVADLINRKKNVLGAAAVPRDGEVAVVTGGSRGIGAEVVKTLVEHGMSVVLGVRDVSRVESLLKSLGSKAVAYNLDTSSPKSVRDFAVIVKSKHRRVHLLVNNAGILRGEVKHTEDGRETQWATNYEGHFLLTHLMLESLKRAGTESKCSRIVNVSSCMHVGARIDFDDVDMKRWHNATAGYSRSKLAQLMFSRFLNKRLEAEGACVKSYAAHPGLVCTDMFFESSGGKSMPWLKHLLKTPREGATPVLHCCLSPELEYRGGAYITNGEEGYSTSYSKDEKLQRRLFEMTCEALDIREFGSAN